MVDKLIVEDIAVRAIRVKDGRIIINLIALLKESLGAIPKGADELKAKQTIAEFMKGFIQDVSILEEDCKCTRNIILRGAC